MKLATIVRTDASTVAGVSVGESWFDLGVDDLDALMASPTWRADVDRSVDRAVPVADIAGFRRPLARPAKVVCCGLNYLDHIAETGREVPEYPTLFAKYASTLTDPEAEIEVVGSSQVDWEAELAVVVGSSLYRATTEQARDAILGYTVANDLSMRDWQSRTLQWLQGKMWDASTPIGPVIVTPDDIDPKAGLAITCTVDGETVQSSSTRELAFDSATLVSYVSHIARLEPGDIVLTGTPSGVGLGRTPKRFLADGETLTTTIEGIGELRNVVRIAPSADAS